jgi:anaerobic selenocysteine-containing dehydrogenase
MGDVAAASALADNLSIPLKIPELAHTPKRSLPQRNYKHPTLDLTVPESGPNFQLLTASHHSYLNSQILPGMERGLQVVHINPFDAEALNIGHGEEVKIIGICGEFRAEALLTDKIVRGCLMCWKNIPMISGYSNHAIPNLLTDAGSGLAYYASFVDIKKITHPAV